MIRTFLDTYGPGQWMLLFYLCGFAGWCWEVSLYLVRERRYVNRGFLFGPILPIYGFGAQLVLFVCLPFADRPLLVALAGTLAASALEYVTGEAMEAIFHVRYWDYSKNRWNLRGHICLLSAATWAAMSVLITCVVHPFLHPWLTRIPDRLALAGAGAMTVFAAVDAFFAVRRALDLRALLESMERYAKELEALHGGLDSVTDRVGDMLRAFAQAVEMRQDALEEKLRAIEAARERMREALDDRRTAIEEAAKERFAGFERVLADITDDLPDLRALREEIVRAREEFERRSEFLHDARMLSRMKKAQRMLHRNPSATSKQHEKPLQGLIRRGGKEEK